MVTAQHLPKHPHSRFMPAFLPTQVPRAVIPPSWRVVMQSATGEPAGLLNLQSAVDKDKQHIPVRFGDVIFAEHSSAGFGGFLYGDGLVQSTVGLQPTNGAAPPHNSARCMFRLVPKLSYDSQNQFGRITRKKSFSRLEVAQFKERADQESKRNVQLLQQLAQQIEEEEDDGSAKINETNLHFGQICQLQHVTSGKFVTAVRQSAINRKDCLQLILDQKGSECNRAISASIIIIIIIFFRCHELLQAHPKVQLSIRRRFSLL